MCHQLFFWQFLPKKNASKLNMQCASVNTWFLLLQKNQTVVKWTEQEICSFASISENTLERERAVCLWTGMDLDPKCGSGLDPIINQVHKGVHT